MRTYYKQSALSTIAMNSTLREKVFARVRSCKQHSLLHVVIGNHIIAKYVGKPRASCRIELFNLCKSGPKISSESNAMCVRSGFMRSYQSVNFGHLWLAGFQSLLIYNPCHPSNGYTYTLLASILPNSSGHCSSRADIVYLAAFDFAWNRLLPHKNTYAISQHPIFPNKSTESFHSKMDDFII